MTISLLLFVHLQPLQMEIRGMNKKDKVVIIGGGLSGLALAFLLEKNKNVKTTLLEASSRLGGRIHTIKGKKGTPLELGATWFADKHENLSTLINELGLQKFPQFSKGITLFQTKSFEPPQQFSVPEAEEPSYRIAGGTAKLIETIGSKLSTTNIRLGSKVTAVTAIGDGITVETADGAQYRGDKAVMCIPPQLTSSQIKFSPGLPIDLLKILPAVQTWMAGAVKFAVEYAEPFWRKKGFSGMIFSHADIIVEMYDQTSFEEDKFGLTGFLNGGSSTYSFEVRKANVLRQLTELLGDEASQPVDYFDKVWNDEFVLEGNPIIEHPHQNGGHPLLQKAYMNGNLLFCGSETASSFPGYMEGAVKAAIKVAEMIE